MKKEKYHFELLNTKDPSKKFAAEICWLVDIPDCDNSCLVFDFWW